MKHSKGPWYKHPKQKVNLRGACFHYRHDITGSEFAEPVASLYGNDIAEANANLIAAAPEMLESLEECYEQFGDDHPIWHRVANAIDKARGKL